MQFFQILNWLLCRVLLLTSQLDKNHISCIEEGAFRALRSLEVLWVSWWVQMKSRRSFISCWEDFDLGFSVSSTLNNNNISSIPVSSFNHMPKLRTLWVSAHRTTLPRMQDCSHGKQERDVKNSRQILTNYFSPFSFFLSMFLNVFFLCCSFFVLLAFFLTPSFAIPSFLYPSLSPPIFPYLPFPVLYFIPRPSFPLTFLHSHLCSYPPQCINSFLPFLFLLPSPLSLPLSSSSQSSPLELSALWLSPGLVVSVAAAAGGVRPLHSVQLSSLAEGPQPRRAAQEWLRLLRYGSPVTRHTQVHLWMMELIFEPFSFHPIPSFPL